jgi:hypothetical protein
VAADAPARAAAGAAADKQRNLKDFFNTVKVRLSCRAYVTHIFTMLFKDTSVGRKKARPVVC